MTQNTENWADIPGYEGLYQISDQGRLKRLESKALVKSGCYRTVRERIRTHQQAQRKYISVPLSKNSQKKTHQIHRLVALQFVPNPHNKPCVNHKDGNRKNNAATNLEWVTYSENNLHAYRTLGRAPVIVPRERNHNTKIHARAVAELQARAANGESPNRLKVEYGISTTHAYRLANAATSAV